MMHRPETGTCPAWWLALAAGVLPFVAVHLCWGLSTAAGHVPACNPYIDGCTSISATGRHGLPYYLFKALIIPTAMVYLAVWAIAGGWLRRLGRGHRAVLLCGLAGALFLILYATFLGSEGALYTWLRRFGARMFFALTAFAQLLLTWHLWRGGLRSRWVRAMLALCAAQLLIGIASLPVPLIVDDPDAIQNVVEWTYALAMNAVFLVLAGAWRQAGLQLRLGSA